VVIILSNTPNLDLENINILNDTDNAYEQIITELINKLNRNNEKVDNIIKITDTQPEYGWWFKEIN
jgi:hypothetical protein